MKGKRNETQLNEFTNFGCDASDELRVVYANDPGPEHS